MIPSIFWCERILRRIFLWVLKYKVTMPKLSFICRGAPRPISPVNNGRVEPSDPSFACYYSSRASVEAEGFSCASVYRTGIYGRYVRAGLHCERAATWAGWNRRDAPRRMLRRCRANSDSTVQSPRQTGRIAWRDALPSSPERAMDDRRSMNDGRDVRGAWRRSGINSL